MGVGIATAFDISALAGASGKLFVAPAQCVIRGFSLGSFGATARLRVRENTVTGKILLTLQIADGQTVGAENLELNCDGDVFVQFVANGADVEGSIWIG